MSKAAKLSVLILTVLLVATLGFAIFTYMNLQQTSGDLETVEQKLDKTTADLQSQQKLHITKANELKGQISRAKEENDEYIQKIKKITQEAEEHVEGLRAQINDITSERDKWERRIKSIREDRDQLMGKIDELTKKLEGKPESQIVYEEREPKVTQTELVPAFVPDVSQAPSISLKSGRIIDEEYWANLLKEKASLEVNIEELEEKLSDKSIAVVEIRQKNEDLQLQVDSLKHEKEDIEAEMQHKLDMVDNLSLELARTKNDKKFITNRAKKLSEDNKILRGQMKQLVSVKNALEKAMVRLSREKEKIEGQLGRTETLIQSKIDEIWEIKDELDRSIRSVQSDTSSNEVELPPIVVIPGEQATNFNMGETDSGFNGKVISINDPNNFVIVDIGENTGVQLGENLSVYRDSKYIARLEVIQVRKDISAADIKDQWSKVKVGDVIR